MDNSQTQEEVCINAKRTFSEISVNDKENDDKFIRMKDINGKSHYLVPTNQIIFEKSQEGSPDGKKTSNDDDHLQKNSCFLASSKSNRFISMKSQIQGFFSKRSCEENSNVGSKKEMKLTKPHSPHLSTKTRIRKECNIMAEENEKKEKKSMTKPNFVFKKFDQNLLNLSENCFENGKFKARKIPLYKTFDIKKSEKDCVVPIGFKLKTQQRGNTKNKENLQSDSCYECNSRDSVDKNSYFDLKEKRKTHANSFRYSLAIDKQSHHFLG